MSILIVCVRCHIVAWRIRFHFQRRPIWPTGKEGLPLFKLLRKLNPGLIKTAIEKYLSSKVTVFQDLASGEFLVELSSKNAAESLIEDGFDEDDVHVICHPSHDYVTNVSIMGLRSYIEDCEVEEALSNFGEVKCGDIRLRYKVGHYLERIENGNRLVIMVVTARSIPYSIHIGREWCRIINNYSMRARWI